MSTYQEDVNDGLTDEERAALAYEEPKEEGAADVNEEEQPSAAAEASAETASGEVVADPVAAADPAAAEPDAAVAAAAEPAVQAPAEQPAAETKPQAQAPILIVQAPEDAEAKLKDIETQKEALTDKWEAGDITNKDYQKQLDALNDQRIDIKMQVERANLATEMEKQRIEREWFASCNAFAKAHPEYQKDGPEFNKERADMLDAALRALAMSTANNGMTNEDALAKAHKMVQGAFGEIQPAQAKALANKTAPPPSVKKPEIPPNIATLPAAAMNDTQGGEFAAIEALRKSGNVEAYEDALDKLSEAARNRYLRA